MTLYYKMLLCTTMQLQHSCLVAATHEMSSPARVWVEKHNGTLAFNFGSGNNVQSIAWSNLWDAKHNGITTFLVSKTWYVGSFPTKHQIAFERFFKDVSSPRYQATPAPETVSQAWGLGIRVP